jgi:ABC-type Fe3+-hydroxamate transport system substrate-binding protein
VRIVSLVPSQSELLDYLGVPPVGVTRFCVQPADLKTRAAVVGGTKQVDAERVRSLRPDWILANKEENTAEMVAALSPIAPVHVTEVSTLSDALAMIRHVGDHVRQPDSAGILAAAIARRFAALKPDRPIRVAYLIWNEPLMTVGGDTFISDVIQRAGWTNAFADQSRYPTITLDDLRGAELDAILLSSEPFPFTAAHATALERATQIRTLLVDGELLSWYGSRLLRTPEYLARLDRQLRA